MRQTVIIFDGEKDQEIGAPYFFQHPLIRDLNEEQVRDLYLSTATYDNVLTNIKDQRHLLKEKYQDPEFHEKVRSGLSILEQMVIDMHGDKLGRDFICAVKLNLLVPSGSRIIRPRRK